MKNASKLTLLAVSGAILVSLSGCFTTKFTNATHAESFAESNTLRANPIVEYKKTKVKGSGTAGGFFNFNILTGSDDAKAAISCAVIDACKKNDADYILAPRYEVTTRTFIIPVLWEKTYVELEGYPATVVGFEETQDGNTYGKISEAK